MLDKLKSLAGDTLIYGIFSIIGRFLTFLLTPFYTNYLDINNPAKPENDFIIYTFSIIAFINVLYSLGMESAYFRFYEMNDEARSKSVFSHSFFSIATISILFALIIILFADSIAPKITNLPNAKSLLILTVFIPVFDALVLIPFARLRMLRKAKRFAITKFVQILITVILNIILVSVFKIGVLGVIISFYFASFIILLIFFKEIKENIILKYDKKLFLSMIKFALPTLPASFSAIILQVADRPILKAMATNASDLAIYGINYKLGIPMMMLVSVFEYAWKPFYMSNHNEANAKILYARVFTYFTLVAAFVFLITSFFIEYIVQMSFFGGRFINPDFWSGMGIIPIILGGYFFNGVFTNFSAGFLIEKKTAYLPIAVGSAAIINVISNIILIPFIGYYGAAYSTLIAYMASAGILYYLSRNIYPIEYEFKRVFLIIGIALSIFFVINTFFNNLSPIINVLIKLIALIIFIILLKITGFFNKEELDTIKKLIKRRK